MSAAAGPIVLLDAAYDETASAAAAILAEKWTAEAPARTLAKRFPPAPPYRSGAFYRRELPLLLALLEEISGPRVVVVDGYVQIDAAGAPGLGAHLHRAIDAAAPVVGVAKSPLAGDDFSIPVRRGASARPLHVTALGMDPRQAADHVAGMAGAHRIPLLLQAVDHAARAALADRSER